MRLLTAWLCFSTAISASASGSALELKAPGVALRAGQWNDVSILDEQGKTLVTLGGLEVKWSPAVKTDGGSLKVITGSGGQKTLEVDYQVPESQPGVRPQVVGYFTPRQGAVDVRFDVSNLPADAKTGGSLFLRRLAKGAVKLPAAKMGLWQRNEWGGLPMEEPDGRLTSYQIGDDLVSFAFGDDNKSNLEWDYAGEQHTAMTATGEGSCTTHFTVLVSPADWPAEAVAARWHDRPVALHIGTDHVYNWWTDHDQPLDLQATYVNASDEVRPVEIKHWVRDFAGDIVSQGTEDQTLAAGQVLKQDIRFTPKDDRDLFFCEVSVTDKNTGKEVFERTNLALLPPHDFASTSADSLVGLSAYWALPDKAGLDRLLQRMGVRWLRDGDTGDFKGITAILHKGMDLKKDYTQAECDAIIRKDLQQAIDQGNPAWEVGNEINFAGMNIGLGNVIQGGLRQQTIEKYVQWLKDIRRVQAEMGPKAQAVKILTFGFAGMDVKFLEGFHDAGGWPLIDGLALHPGRGNFTPDYPVYDPPVETPDWRQWQIGAYGSYWNYYGSILTAKKLIAKYGGDKSLWLTEVYSPGFPNTFWDDSPRNGAEDALLSLALAKAEGVKAVMWYQLFDSVWFDQLGINPNDREYFFGLIQRDLSFKPSFMAFCAAAEALDGAVFKGWLKFPEATNPKTRGLRFDTPRGPMSVLWDRTDGYILSKNTPHFASTEPWVHSWKTHTPVTLSTTGDSVTVVNFIGQSRTVPAPGHSVTLELTGAPLIVYGVDASKMR